MAEKTLLADFRGLVTAPGLMMRDTASCVVANNVLFDAPGLVRKLPGFQRLTRSYGSQIHSLHSTPLLNTRILAHLSAVSAQPTALRLGDGTAASTVVNSIDGSAFTRPLVTKMRSAVLGQSLYLTTDEGLRRVESALTTGRFAGMPRGLSPSTANMDPAVFGPVLFATNPWLPAGSSVAYRVTWHRLDDSGVELGGPPSGRTTIRNITGTSGYAAGTAAVNVWVPIPYEFGTASTALTTSYFGRLWRTRDFSASEPDDEMSLVEEFKLTAPTIAAGFYLVQDFTPSTLLSGAPKLHTNPVAFPDGAANLTQGALNADDPPPAANCVASWRSCLWEADVISPASSVIQLVALGLAAGDTVSLDGINTLTAVAGVPAANQFTNVTGLATLALNLEATARNIVEAHNLNFGAGSSALAYYTSVGTESPGIITMHTKQTYPFTPLASGTSSKASVWRFGAPARSGGTNVLRYSRALRGDAFPLVNSLDVGSSQTTILQIVPFRSSLFVFTDQGIYVVTGSSWADFNVQPFDLSRRLLGRELLAVVDDEIYAWCWDGIVRVDEAGVEPISSPIEPTLTALLGANPSNFAAYSFAVGYRLQHRVVFFYGTVIGQIQNAFVFDTRTKAWSTMSIDKGSGTIADAYRSCGVVRFSDDRLVLGNLGATGDSYLFEERRSLTASDYNTDNAAGVTDPVSSQLAFQFAIPDSEGAAHWRQVVTHLDGGEFAWRAYPTQFNLAWSTEWATLALGLTPDVGAPLVRAETPTAVRRGNRMRLQYTHALAEAFGLVGVAQSVEVATRFARVR